MLVWGLYNYSTNLNIYIYVLYNLVWGLEKNVEGLEIMMAQLRAPLKPLDTIVLRCPRDFRGTFDRAPNARKRVYYP